MSLLAPSPPLRLQFFYPGSSNPLSGGQVISVQPGTLAVYNQAPSYPMITYQDALGVTQNVNPGVLDGSGSISMFLAGPTDLYVFDPNGNLVVTQKNVSAAPSTSSTQWITQSTTAAYISATSFTVPGNQTSTYSPGTRVLATISSGNIYGTISSSSATGSAPIFTTVNVVWDNNASLNNSVTSISLGINTGGWPTAVPVPPLITSAATVWSATIGTMGQVLLFTGSSVTVNIPAGNTFPSGGTLEVKAGANTLYAVGTVTIDNIPAAGAVTVSPYSFKKFMSDSNQWWTA